MIDVAVEHVSKKYLISQEAQSDEARPGVVQKLQQFWRRRQEFWALRDVSFEVKRGESLGIIGPNGAGKSTILKLLASITIPSAGVITLNGRLSALIEVGSGFHPDLTGRENIYLSGSILGMRRVEINRKLESIIDFAGIRSFIDTPVKRYSSGMYVRLGFSIAAHLDPDILLLDEVLAVGDAAFQSKCLERIGELEKAGKTILFISHDLKAVERLCDRVLLLNQGQIVAEGKAADVISSYQELTRQSRAIEKAASAPTVYSDVSPVTINGFAMFGEDGKSRREFEFGEEVGIRIELEATARIDWPMINLGIVRSDGVNVCNFNNWYDNFRIGYIEGNCTLEGWLPGLRLIPGNYDVHVLVWRDYDDYFRGNLSRMKPLASEYFGYFTLHGPPLRAEQDGVFQQPAKKWVFVRDGHRVEYTNMDADSLNCAYNNGLEPHSRT